MTLVDDLARSLAQPSAKLHNGAAGAVVTGENIVGMLQQAAERAKEAEHVARAKARDLQELLDRSEKRIQDLEVETAAMEQRAIEAEGWILRVSREIQDGWVGSVARKRG